MPRIASRLSLQLIIITAWSHAFNLQRLNLMKGTIFCIRRRRSYFFANESKDAKILPTISSSGGSNSDPVIELLPQLYTYQKPRQKRRTQSTRKPRFYWHDKENMKKELTSFWEEDLNVTLTNFFPNQPPPIPSEFLLNHFNRNDLRWAIAQMGGRHTVSHVLGGAKVIPGKWKEAKKMDMMQSLLHLIDDDRGAVKKGSAKSSGVISTDAENSSNNELLASIAPYVNDRSKKEFWSKTKAITTLYSYLDSYKKYKSRPSVWMPQLSELKHEGYSKLFNACSRFKMLPDGDVFAKHSYSKRLPDGNTSIEYMAGLTPFKEWRFFESQLQLFVELQHYLNLHHAGNEGIFPDPADVKSRGHVQLSHLIRIHGGKQLLATKLNMDLASNISVQSWGPFSLNFAVQLLQFIRERYMTMSPPLLYPIISMPSEQDLIRFGCAELAQQVEIFGGYENVARRLGLAFFDGGKNQQVDVQLLRRAQTLWKKRSI